MIVRVSHKSGRNFIAATGSCCLHRTGSSICNLSFHYFFVLENTPAKKIPERGDQLWYIQENMSDAKVF
jgi:hypothetical protein